MGLEVQSGEEKIELAKDGDLKRHEKKEEYTSLEYILCQLIFLYYLKLFIFIKLTHCLYLSA